MENPTRRAIVFSRLGSCPCRENKMITSCSYNGVEKPSGCLYPSWSLNFGTFTLSIHGSNLSWSLLNWLRVEMSMAGLSGVQLQERNLVTSAASCSSHLCTSSVYWLSPEFLEQYLCFSSLIFLHSLKLAMYGLKSMLFNRNQPNFDPCVLNTSQSNIWLLSNGFEKLFSIS